MAAICYISLRTLNRRDGVHLSSVAMFVPVSMRALPFAIVVSRFVYIRGGCCHLRGDDVGSKQVIGDGRDGVLGAMHLSA